MAVTNVTSVRMNDEEAKLINNYANLIGESASTLLKKALLEKIEDMLDLQALNEVLESSTGETTSLQDMMVEFEAEESKNNA